MRTVNKTRLRARASAKGGGTCFDSLLYEIKDHYVIALAAVFGMGVIALSQFYDAMVGLASHFVPPGHGLRFVDVKVIDEPDKIHALHSSLRQSGIDISGGFPLVDIIFSNVSDDPVVLSSIDYTAVKKHTTIQAPSLSYVRL